MREKQGEEQQGGLRRLTPLPNSIHTPPALSPSLWGPSLKGIVYQPSYTK